MSDMSQQFADWSQGFVGGGQAGTVIGYGDPVPTLTAVEATGAELRRVHIFVAKSQNRSTQQTLTSPRSIKKTWRCLLLT